MLLAYIDEIGETGAFAGRGTKYGTSPAFGYAGFVVPEDEARRFGAVFTKQKNTLFKKDAEESGHQGRWEKKGSEVFHRRADAKNPQNLRVFNYLVGSLRKSGGYLFYYADEKPIGTPRQTGLNAEGRTAREGAAMRETLNRLATHAAGEGKNLLVMMDQINEKARQQRLPAMYQHIYGRAGDHEEMRAIVEPPMHIDSIVSANIQFADWVAACVGRAIDYQLILESQYGWIVQPGKVNSVRGAFTRESKLHLWQRDLPDLNHSRIFDRERVVHPEPWGSLIGSGENMEPLQKAKAAAERTRRDR